MVGEGVVRARGISACVEGSGVAVAGVEGASVLENDVVGNRVVEAEVVVAGVEEADEGGVCCRWRHRVRS